jgi:hypothetical protein
MTQAQTHGTTFKKVMLNPLFSEGYRDAMNGVNFYDRYEKIVEFQQFAYERGRHFFFAVGKVRIKQGKGLNKEALTMFKYLFIQKAIL